MKPLFVAVLICVAGCAKTPNYIDKSLPGRPQKPMPGVCETVDGKVTQVLFTDTGFHESFPLFLPDGSCGVAVILNGHGRALEVARKLRDKYEFYSHVLEGKTLVSLWFDEPAATEGDHGENLTATPTDDECNVAAEKFSHEFPDATVQVAKSGVDGPARLRCFVDASFPTDVLFEKFLKWDNKESKAAELFHMNVLRSGKTYSTVWIRALRAAR